MKITKFRIICLAAAVAAAMLAASCASESSKTDNGLRPADGEAVTSNSDRGRNSNMVRESSTDAKRDAASGIADHYSPERSSGERYAQLEENPFFETKRAPLSTFSIDVDTASYSNVRRYLNNGQKPPKDAVRIEELVNYFEYDYPQPVGGAPFSVTTEVAKAPWNQAHKLVQIGLQGKQVSMDNLPPSNLVFLLDVSGSMNAPDKLPLLKSGLRMMINQLSPKDRVAIVAYAGATGLVLPSTSVANKNAILGALNNLSAGGSTNGGAGIQLAYSVAKQNFIKNGNNRVILATDGDFNVGLSNDQDLVNLIEQKRKSNIFLSVFGFGSGNLNDSMMEKLSNKGNGNYAYIDSSAEAKKALGSQIAGTLYTIAKDVKIQVEFNPAKVAGYRLLGYENRVLADRDFNDDTKDAGEIGAGISVTALYEIVPAGQKVINPGVDELRYAKVEPSNIKFADELMTVKLRYKDPNGTTSRLLTQGILDSSRGIDSASNNMKFASSVVEFGLLLRDSKYRGGANFSNVRRRAGSSLGTDLRGYRKGFLEMVAKAGS